ncbi:hypothetical protein ACEWY4_008771 [Coilia grayii]|uniref:CCHC-type domain-containing protein n=1 Tax=Coilia grayii TaxID=363190 RepID=A0ABD1KBX2_9TELE
MADPGEESLTFLTRRHAVKITSPVSIEACSLAIGELIGHPNILSASRMNNAIVLFLRTIELANDLVESGVVIDGGFTEVLPLSTPTKKVTLSNVPPFIDDLTLSEMLSRYGKIVSPIRMIPIASKSPLLKHVVSFRRSVYMILKEDNLDVTLNVKVDNFNYLIYVSSNVMKCFGCGQFGHLVRACPENGKNNSAPNDKPEASGVPEASNKTTEDDIIKETVAQPQGKVTENTLMDKNMSKDLNVQDVEKDIAGGEVVDTEINECTQNTQSSTGSAADADSVGDSQDTGGVYTMETDEALFKIPKRKRPRANRKEKKSDLVESAITDGESESEFSDCSISYSLRASGFSPQTYTVDDIKAFLVKTKHARRVCIDDHFPDVDMFIEKTKCFMSDGDFTDQEVYRLKKILTKLSNGDGSDKIC